MNTRNQLPPPSSGFISKHVHASNVLPTVDSSVLRSTGSIAEVPQTRGPLTNLLRSSSKYNNNYDAQANGFSKDSKNRYIKADNKYFSITQTNMDIHSGTRTVRRQAELYIQHEWHGRGNPASWPGCSFHNYGVAADMVMIDKDNVTLAMNSTGWTGTKSHEKWHFECTASGDHDKAADKIKKLRRTRTGLAYRWSEQTAHFFQKTEESKGRKRILDEGTERYHQVTEALLAESRRLGRIRDELNGRIDEHNRAVDVFGVKHKRAKELYDDLVNNPESPNYDDKLREYEELLDWLEAEENRLAAESAEFDGQKELLDKQYADLKSRMDERQRMVPVLEEARDAWFAVNREIADHERKAENLLGQIESQMP